MKFNFNVSTNHTIEVVADRAFSTQEIQALTVINSDIRQFVSERVDKNKNLFDQIMEYIGVAVSDEKGISVFGNTLTLDYEYLIYALGIKKVIGDDVLKVNESEGAYNLSIDEEKLERQFEFDTSDFGVSNKKVSILKKNQKAKAPLYNNDGILELAISELPKVEVIKETDKYLTFEGGILKFNPLIFKSEIRERIIDGVGRYLKILGGTIYLDFTDLKNDVLRDLKVYGDDYLKVNHAVPDRISLTFNLQRILTNYIEPLEGRINESLKVVSSDLASQKLTIDGCDTYLYLTPTNELGLSNDRLIADIKNDMNTVESVGTFLSYEKGVLNYKYIEFRDWLKIPRVEDFVPKVYEDDYLKLSRDEVLYIDMRMLKNYLFSDLVDNNLLEYKNDRITFDYYKLLDLLKDDLEVSVGESGGDYVSHKLSDPYWRQSLNAVKIDKIIPLEGVVNLSYIPRGDLLDVEIQDPNIPDSWILRDDLKPTGLDSKRFMFEDGLELELQNQMVRVKYVY